MSFVGYCDLSLLLSLGDAGIVLMTDLVCRDRLRKHDGYSEPIKSKEALIFHTGFRHYSTRYTFITSQAVRHSLYSVKNLLIKYSFLTELYKNYLLVIIFGVIEGGEMFLACLVCRPIFSSDDLNMDKHKFERFLPPGQFAMASVFARISFPTLPVVVFKDSPDGVQLVAAGSLRSVDPDQIILKRIVLSGYRFITLLVQSCWKESFLCIVLANI